VALFPGVVAAPLVLGTVAGCGGRIVVDAMKFGWVAVVLGGGWVGGWVEGGGGAKVAGCLERVRVCSSLQVLCYRNEN
jgi:hypothetical protein